MLVESLGPAKVAMSEDDIIDDVEDDEMSDEDDSGDDMDMEEEENEVLGTECIAEISLNIL